MDILSFGLGIAVVVIIGLSVISVIAFFKVKKIEKQIEHIESDIYRTIGTEIAETHRRIDDFESHLFFFIIKSYAFVFFQQTKLVRSRLFFTGKLSPSSKKL